ncbi:hypothetical protein EJB05_11173, partial [Eragrostis curvula]
MSPEALAIAVGRSGGASEAGAAAQICSRARGTVETATLLELGGGSVRPKPGGVVDTASQT